MSSNFISELVTQKIDIVNAAKNIHCMGLQICKYVLILNWYNLSNKVAILSTQIAGVKTPTFNAKYKSTKQFHW